MSSVTTSGLTCGMRCSAIAPFAAAPTTSMPGILAERLGDQPADHHRVVDDQDADLRVAEITRLSDWPRGARY